MSSKFYKGANKNTRDKAFIKSMSGWLVPRVYAAIACELWDDGWTEEQIQDLFARSQARWQDSVENNWDMLKNVQEVTGIQVEYFRKTGNIV